MPKVVVGLECSICLNCEVDEDWVSLIACGHIFHEQCIRKWTDSTVEGSRKKQQHCPKCREEILRIPAPKKKRGSIGQKPVQSRFRKLMFDSSEVRLLDSSSPVKGGSQGHVRSNKVNVQAGPSRNRLIVEDVLDDNDAWDGEGGLTESESDEENARPAQRYNPRARVAATDSLTDAQMQEESSDSRGASRGDEDGGTPQAPSDADLRAEVARLKSLVCRKSHRLDSAQAQITQMDSQVRRLEDTIQRKMSSLEEFESQVREMSNVKKRLQDELNAMKSAKKEMSMTLKKEMEESRKCSDVNKSLSLEIDTLKTSLNKTKKALESVRAEYAEFKESSDDTNVELQQKLNRVTKLHEAVTNNYKTLEVKYNKRKLKLQELEETNEKLKKQTRQSASITILPPNLTNKQSRRRISALQEEDADLWEESLQIEEVPDTDKEPMYSEVEFDDLDFGYGISSVTGKLDYKGKGKAVPPSSARPKTGPRNPFADYSNQTSASTNAAVTTKKSALKPVNKWTDMVLTGSSLALGDRKKARTKF